MKLVVPFKVFFSLKTSTMSLKRRTYKTWVCSILFFALERYFCDFSARVNHLLCMFYIK